MYNNTRISIKRYIHKFFSFDNDFGYDGFLQKSEIPKVRSYTWIWIVIILLIIVLVIYYNNVKTNKL